VAEVKWGEPCTSTSPRDDVCTRPRSHKNDHQAERYSRFWTGGIRTAAQWVCPTYSGKPCGDCDRCSARVVTGGGA
jgi:hypothetical protein